MSYTRIQARVNDQTIQLVNVPLLASGGRNEIIVDFTFCQMWDEAGKTAVFYRSPEEAYHVLLVDNSAVIPAEVMATEGRVFFGVFGTSADQTRTTEVVALNVVAGAITIQGIEPGEPTPDIYQQISSAYGLLASRVDELVAMRGGAVTTRHDLTAEHIYGSISSNGYHAAITFMLAGLSIAANSWVYTDYCIPPSLVPFVDVAFGSNPFGLSVRMSASDLSDGWGRIAIYNETGQTVDVAADLGLWCDGDYALASPFIPELADVRVAADGTTYPTAGEAVREQTGNAVSYLPQTPTAEQRTQARENLGAAEQTEYGIVIKGQNKSVVEVEAFDQNDQAGNTYSRIRLLGYHDGAVEINGVADGIYDDDAATVGQLKSVVGEIETALDLLHDYAEIVINGGVITTNERYFLIDSGVVSLNPDNVDDLPSTVGIPDSIGGEPVTALAEGMFQHNKTVKKIYLPESITVIPRAFCNEATNLEHIYGTENVTEIGGGGFRFTRLKEANFPNLTRLGKSAFFQCCYLERANIGNTITEIPQAAFYGCESLTEIDGGSSITSIGYMGLTYTTALETLPFADNVTNIGDFGLLGSKVKYDWLSRTDVTYGNAATYAQLNPDRSVWEGKTYTPCEIPLLSTFDQNDPQWRTAKYSNTYTDDPNDVYLNNCVACSGAVIYSAYNGVEFAAPGDFTRFVYESDTSEGKTVANKLSYSMGCDTAFEMFGYEVEKCSYYPEDPNEKGLQYLYDSLAAGKLCVIQMLGLGETTEVDSLHLIVAYGIKENGDIMFVDSEPNRGMWIDEPAGIPSLFGDYRAIRYSMPIQNLVTFQTSSGKRPYFVVISKPEVEA